MHASLARLLHKLGQTRRVYYWVIRELGCGEPAPVLLVWLLQDAGFLWTQAS